MKRTLPAHLLGIVLLLSLSWVTAAAEPPRTGDEAKPALPDLSEYRTVDKAITTRVSRAAPSPLGQTGYLGVYLQPDPRGRLAIADLEEESPATKAGLLRDDVLLRVEGREVPSAEVFRELLKAKSPGETVKLSVLRGDKPMELTATLGATSRPMSLSTTRATLGLRLGEAKDGQGLPISAILPGSPAEKAKLKVGEIVLKIDGSPLTEPSKLNDFLADKKPDDAVTLTLLLAEKTVDLKVTLAGETAGGGRRGGGGGNWDDRVGSTWKKDTYRLGVVCVEYPDVKHNTKISTKDWEEALFTKGTYVNRKSATGQTVYGSLNDYYQEQSYGNLRVEGKVFDWVEVGKKRADYNQTTGGGGGGNRSPLLTEALDQLLARDKDALKDIDGLFFLYAGGRVQTNRGGLYWPHRSNVNHGGKRWAYFICAEGGERMGDISIICHEFGHMLGLPDPTTSQRPGPG
jgi:hypothetical protein